LVCSTSQRYALLQISALSIPIAVSLRCRFLEINPRGKVPALRNNNDDTVVYESSICDEYLSDLARSVDPSGGPPPSGRAWMLMPPDAAGRARVRLLCDRIDSELCPAQFTYLMNKDGEKDKEMREDLERALGVLEEALTSSGGPYLAGEDFTLADIHVLPFYLRLTVTLRHYKGYEVPRDKFPKLAQWFEVCSEKASVKVAALSEERIVEVYDRFMDVDYSFGGLNKNK